MKGTLLTQRSALGAALQRAGSALDRAEGKAGAAGGYLLGGLALSALSVAGRPLPLAACLLYGAAGWSCRLGALAGAAAGYALFFGPAAAFEQWTLCLCLMAASRMLRRAACSEALVLGAATATVGLIFAAQTGFRPLDLMHAAVNTAAAAGVLPLVRSFTVRPAGGKQPSPPAPDLRALNRAGAALELMHETLARQQPPSQPSQLAELFDFAAQQVCHCCTGFSQCWEQDAEQTYRDLCAAGDMALARGAALREDFPQGFQTKCSHMEGFLTAVNQALDRSLARHRDARRREESRLVAAGQYELLAGILRSAARPSPDAPVCYHPELAVGSSSRAGSRVSGDRGAACKDRFGNFYVLLCDGMGTGPEARAESDRAARLLSAFLEAGAEADSALVLLNGFYAMAQTAAFSTVDLLRLDLRTGSGTLYKWGAAPSYLRTAGGVKKIGTVTPPPGLDAANCRAPGQYALSLREEETLVMVSDGAFSEQTEQRLASMTGGSVRDLASCLIALEEAAAADDRTAVVIRLHRLTEEKRQAAKGR